MSDKLISIILPVYNTESYLSQCLDSIFKQSYTNFKIIAVDDGSTDNSGKLLDEMCLRDPRLFVIHQKNAGVSAARNTALDYINQNFPETDYICFIDSDDYVEFNYLQNYMAGFDNDSVDAVFCGFDHITKKGPLPSKYTTTPTENTINSNESIDYIFRLNRFSGKAYPSTSTFLANKIFRFSKTKKFRFNEDISFGEDTLWLIKAVENSRNVRISNLITYHYRQRKSSISNRVNIADQYIVLAKEMFPTIVKYNMTSYWWSLVTLCSDHGCLEKDYSFLCSLADNLTFESFKMKKRFLLFKSGTSTIPFIRQFKRKPKKTLRINDFFD